jgi:hypothetical protein
MATGTSRSPKDPPATTTVPRAQQSPEQESKSATHASALAINLTDQQRRDLASRLGLGDDPDMQEIAQFVTACIGTVLQLDYEARSGKVLILRDVEGSTERQIRIQIGRAGLSVEYPPGRSGASG